MTVKELFDFLREVDLKTEELIPQFTELTSTGYLSRHTIEMLEALVKWRRISLCEIEED
jgi:hypothetical protein